MHSLVQVRVHVANCLVCALLGRGYVYCSSLMKSQDAKLFLCLPTSGVEQSWEGEVWRLDFRLKCKGPEECLNGIKLPKWFIIDAALWTWSLVCFWWDIIYPRLAWNSPYEDNLEPLMFQFLPTERCDYRFVSHPVWTDLNFREDEKHQQQPHIGTRTAAEKGL